MNFKSISSILFIALFFISCEEQPQKLQISEDIPEISNKIFTRGQTVFNENNTDFLNNFSKKIKTAVISEEDATTFILKALEKIDYHSYRSEKNFTYYYGDIIYRSEDIIAISFNCQGENEKHEISAMYIATYRLNDNELIDCKILNSFSEFNLKNTKGYSRNEILTHEIEVINNEQVALKINCDLKIRYYNRGDEKKKENIDTDFVYILNKKGEFTLEEV